jgi:acyl-[acyl-carrier-protein]-phospholipid O-acyltransferase/long-chain-fatty-acid--[acyl-carrier-protein] ligase
MVPAEILVLDHVPVLGSGKLDYVGVNKLVGAMLSASVAAVA